jgi:hypothetical protein
MLPPLIPGNLSMSLLYSELQSLSPCPKGFGSRLKVNQLLKMACIHKAIDRNRLVAGRCLRVEFAGVAEGEFGLIARKLPAPIALIESVPVSSFLSPSRRMHQVSIA